MFWTYEFQGAQHMISTHKPNISLSHKDKSKMQGTSDVDREQPRGSLHQQLHWDTRNALFHWRKDDPLQVKHRWKDSSLESQIFDNKEKQSKAQNILIPILSNCLIPKN